MNIQYGLCAHKIFRLKFHITVQTCFFFLTDYNNFWWWTGGIKTFEQVYIFLNVITLSQYRPTDFSKCMDFLCFDMFLYPLVSRGNTDYTVTTHFSFSGHLNSN